MMIRILFAVAILFSAVSPALAHFQSGAHGSPAHGYPHSLMSMEHMIAYAVIAVMLVTLGLVIRKAVRKHNLVERAAVILKRLRTAF